MSHHSRDKSLTDLMSLVGVIPEHKKLESFAEQLNRSTAINDQMSDTLGPTKDYPHGRIVPHDEGGLMFGVTVFNGRVIFDFGTPVRSIGFTREGALELAELIRQRAEQCPAILFPKGGRP